MRAWLQSRCDALWQRWQTRWGVMLWLVLAGLLLVGAALRFVWGATSGLPLQTNILALLPATERNPVAELAVNRLTSAAGDRAVFLIGHADSATASAAARRFAAALTDSHAFSSVLVDVPPMDVRQLTALYAAHQHTLLSATDSAWLTQEKPDLAQRLRRKIDAPFQFGLTLPLAQDPLGFSDSWLASLPLQSLKLMPEDGLLLRHTDTATWVFVNAQLPASAYDRATQDKLMAAVRSAEAGVSAATVLRTGTVFYAAEARMQGEHEFDVIGAGSLIGMLLLLYWMFRSLRPLLLGLLSVGFGILAALLGVVCVYGEMHLITLVFGASLIGEAIDYAVQYFAAHLGAGPNWQPLPGLRRITPGLCVALCTSLLGYTVLTFAPFPVLKQIALFAMIGLLAAWLSVFLLLPAFLNKPSKRDPQLAVARPQRWLQSWQALMTPRRSLILILALPLLSVPGWLRLSSDDDVRQLITRPPALQAQEEQIRSLTGFDNSSQFFLVEGASPEALLQNEEKLTQRLQGEHSISGYQAISTFVPSAQTQAANYRLLHDKIFADPLALRKLFSTADLRDDIADKQLTAFATADKQMLSIDEWLAAPISHPFRHLWLGEQGSEKTFAAIVMPQGIRDAATLDKLRTLATGLVGVTFVDKAQSVSTLFGVYRQWAGLWLAGAVVLVGIVLLVRYPWHVALRVLLPTVLSLGLTLALFGYLNKPLTLFNLMGLMLVLGIGANYAIFLREGGVSAAATLAGVILSAGTTLLSFGLLAFSSMPALSGFGLTLLTGIACAALLAPLSLPSLPMSSPEQKSP